MGGYTTHVRCSVDGTIWAGYFDEGVFGGSAIAEAGIARFDAGGQVIWRFNDEAGRNLFVDDCYALTLDGETLWSCFYSDFPIVKVDQGAVTHWGNEIAGARTLAVDGDYVLLAGGYKEDSSRLALLQLVDGEARLRGQWQFMPPDRDKAGLVQGREGMLHVISDGQWRKIWWPRCDVHRAIDVVAGMTCAATSRCSTVRWCSTAPASSAPRRRSRAANSAVVPANAGIHIRRP